MDLNVREVIRVREMTLVQRRLWLPRLDLECEDMTWFKEGRPRGTCEAKGDWRTGKTLPGRGLEVGPEKAGVGGGSSMEGEARSFACTWVNLRIGL